MLHNYRVNAGVKKSQSLKIKIQSNKRRDLWVREKKNYVKKQNIVQGAKI